MRIASVLVRTSSPTKTKQALLAIPGVQIHISDAEKHALIVTVEDGEGYDVADSLTLVSKADGVLSAALVYEHTDEHPEQVGA
ncbi:MAG: chaperone NapD [Corticimicrobacter sp.]|uniref:chaperone NapD n=1 Tax=Corticimicrobacter sp. TaxID=2678536 RepID=UPI0032D9F298